MENIVEYYYEQLSSHSNPGQLLAHFYGELTNKIVGKTEVIMCNKLIRIFGKYNVYFSILELGKYEDDKVVGNPYPLLFTICKSRFEKEFKDSPSAASTDLNKYVANVQKEIEKAKKAKIKVPDATKLGEVDGGKSI